MVVVLSAEFLRAQQRFGVVSFATVTFTLPILVAIVAFRSVIGVAIGVATGAALRYVSQIAVIGRHWRRTPAGEVRPGGTVRPTDVTAAFGIQVMLAGQVSIPLVLAAVLGDAGDVALLNYGWRILLIPIGLLGSVFSVAAYPSIVRLLQDESEPSHRHVAGIVRPTVLLSVVVGVWVWVNAASAIAAVYRPAGLGDIALVEISSEIRARGAQFRSLRSEQPPPPCCLV